MKKPLFIELFAGLHGWGEAAVQEGFFVVGFDIVDMCAEIGHPRPEGCHLVIQDVLTIHGSQFKDATVIVASPPCQAYSYRAMPWKRAKALPPPDNSLFEACFRIQREACEAAGRYIPLIVENVRGAQKWVGRAKANFGSYYLWGDVGMVGKRVVAGVPRFGVSVTPMKATKVPGFRFDGVSHGSFQSASVEAQKRNPDGTEHGPGSWFAIADSKNRGAKTEGQNWSRFKEIGEVSPHWRMEAVKVPSGNGSPRTDVGNGARFTSRDCGEEGKKIGGDWFSDPTSTCRKHGSKSKARKAASAMIAKIPFPLAVYIARAFKDQ